MPTTPIGSPLVAPGAESPLTLKAYQASVVSTDQKKDSGVDLSFPLLGLFGETGSLLSEAKKSSVTLHHMWDTREALSRSLVMFSGI
jgi:hypothetical protein